MNSNEYELLSAIPKVNLTIDCRLEGKMGSMEEDNPEAPKSLCVHMDMLWYFAGDPNTLGQERN